MRELMVELKQLRLHGMALAWADLVEQGGEAVGGSLDASRWLVEHLLQAETTDRAMRSVSQQITRPSSRYTATSPASTSRPRRWIKS